MKTKSGPMSGGMWAVEGSRAIVDVDAECLPTLGDLERSSGILPDPEPGPWGRPGSVRGWGRPGLARGGCPGRCGTLDPRSWGRRRLDLRGERSEPFLRLGDREPDGIEDCESGGYVLRKLDPGGNVPLM